MKHGADEGSLRRSRLLRSCTATPGERRNRATWLSSLHPGLTLCGLRPRQPPAHRTGSSCATSRRLGGASTAANSRRSDLPGEPRLLTVRDQPWTWARAQSRRSVSAARAGRRMADQCRAVDRRTPVRGLADRPGRVAGCRSGRRLAAGLCRSPFTVRPPLIGTKHTWTCRLTCPSTLDARSPQVGGL